MIPRYPAGNHPSTEELDMTPQTPGDAGRRHPDQDAPRTHWGVLARSTHARLLSAFLVVALIGVGVGVAAMIQLG